MTSLTPMQGRLLAFLRDYYERSGVMPTLSEMTEGLGLQGKSGAFRLLRGLEVRGHIRRMPNRNRAIELIDPNPLAGFSNDQLINELERRGCAHRFPVNPPVHALPIAATKETRSVAQ